MLLFLLSFYFHYDLFNCDEHETNAKFNESLVIHKHHQNLLRVNAFLNDAQQKILEKSVLTGNYETETTGDKDFVYDNLTNWHSKAPAMKQKNRNLKDDKILEAKFHPSPQYDPFDRRQGLFQWLPPVSSGVKVQLPPLVTPYPISLFPLKNPGLRPPYPNNPGLRPPYPNLLRPIHSTYPRMLPRFSSDNRYQNVYIRPLYPYMPNPSHTPGPKHKGQLFLYAIDSFLYQNPHLLNSLHPTISPPISDPAVSSKTTPPASIPSSKIRTPTIGYNAKIWLKEIAPYTPVIEKFMNLKKDQTATHRSEKTTVLVTNRMLKINDYWFSNGTANPIKLFNEDEHGFLYVTLPENDEIQVQTNDPNKNWMSTAAGDVLHGKITVQKPSTPSPKQRYLDMMEQLDEGYMMVFMIELCRIIAVKDRREVRDVLYNTEMIYNSLWDNGRLAWIGDPLETVIWKLSIMMSGRDIDLVRTYASMMFHMLLRRKQTLSAEVNSIIDEADLFYNHDEGDRLLYSLKQFEDFPNTTKNSYWLCDSLIETFLLPFRRLSGTRRRQRLVHSINKALKQRFPHLLREHNEGTLAGKASNGSQSRKRKRKRHHHSYKKKRERKGHRTPEYSNKNIYGRQFSQDIDSKESILRTMSPVTSDQPRFRVTTTKSYRIKSERPTTAYLNLGIRSNRNRKPKYQKTSTFQDKLDSFDSKNDKSTVRTFYYYHQYGQKTSPVEHKTSTGPVHLASRRFHSPGRSKRTRKDKKLFYRIKDGLQKSETNKKDIRLKLKAEQLRKIIEGSSYSDEEELLRNNMNEALRHGNRNYDVVDDTR